MRALGTTVAGVADKGGKRDPAVAGDLFRRRLHLQANLPMAGVVTQRHRAAIARADPPLRANNQHLFAGEFIGIPPHPGVLRHAKQITARRFHQHLRGQGQRPLWPGRVGDHRIEGVVLRGKNLLYRHRDRPTQQSLSCCSSVFSCALRGSSSGPAGGSTWVETGRTQSEIASLITFTNGASS